MFTVWECEFAFWRCDASDVPLTIEEYLGGCAERIDFSETIERVRFEYPGRRHGKAVDADESHEIRIDNLWLRSSETAAMPQVRRRERYVAVFRWESEDSGEWVVRTYYGVTVDERGLSGDAVGQSWRFAAEHYVEESGVDVRAPLTPAAATMWVDYVNGSERTLLYRFEGGLFVPVDAGLLATRAEIEQAGGECEVSFAGVGVRLRGTASALQFTFVYTGRTYMDTPAPKLEFFVGSQRSATVNSDGVLAVGNIVEQPTAPGGGMEVRDGATWLFTFLGGVCYAPAFGEIVW